MRGTSVQERFLPLRMCKHFSDACDNAQHKICMGVPSGQNTYTHYNQTCVVATCTVAGAH